MFHKKFSLQKGITAIEVVVGVSIAGVVLVYAAYTVNQFINTARDVSEKTEALYLAEDGLELIRYMRDNDWTEISARTVGTTYYLNVTGTTVHYTTTPEVINGFTRSFVIQNVYRNTSTQDIVASTTGGSAVDINSKYITATVSWGSPIKTVSLTTILTDIES